MKWVLISLSLLIVLFISIIESKIDIWHHWIICSNDNRIDGVDYITRKSMIYLIIMIIEQIRLNEAEWDSNIYSLEYYFIDCIHATKDTKWKYDDYNIDLALTIV